MEKVPHQRRILAYAIDIIICVVMAIFLTKSLNIHIESKFFKYFEILSLFVSLILFIYLFLCYMFFNGCSVGKAICGARIIKSNGSNMNLADIFIRSFMQSILIFIFINFFYQIYNKTYKSLFDYATNTKSIFIRSQNEKN